MHLIISKDKEEIRRALASLLKKVAAPCVSFYPDTFSIENFSQEVETLPFLSKQKNAIVYELDQLKEEQREVIRLFIEKPNPWVSLYLTATALAPQSKLVKAVEKKGKVLRFRDEKPWEKEKRLATWLVQEAKEQGVTFPLQAAILLVQMVDHQMLKHELDKLICYVGERKEISSEDIRVLSTAIHHETLWQLGDAIFADQKEQALTIGKILLDEGISIFPILASLRTQMYTGLEILQAAEKNEVGKKFPYLKGRLLEKKLRSLKQFGVTRLKRGLVLLFESEIQAKNSSINPFLLLELLFVKCIDDSLSFSKYAGAS